VVATQPSTGTGSYVAPQSQSGSAGRAGTIVYSGNGGMNWVVQQGPLFPTTSANVVPRYSLFSVAVVKGTVAFAVGGNEYVNSGASSNGCVLATSNGGYTWVVEPIASFTFNLASANLLNSPRATTPVSATYAGLTIPLLMGVAAQRTPAGTIVVWAVGCSGVMLQSKAITLPALSQTVNNAKAGPGLGFSLVQTPAWAIGQHFSGIVWDNHNIGYAYGVGFILATHDAGLTWSLETPAPLVNAYAALDGSNLAQNNIVSSIATVPTTY